MASALLVVLNSGSPTALDELFEDRLTGLGHTVTLVSDSSVSGSLAGKELLVTAPSCREYEFSPSLFQDAAVPVVSCSARATALDQGYWDGSPGGFEDFQNLILSTHPTTSGLSSPLSAFSSATGCQAYVDVNAGGIGEADIVAHAIINSGVNCVAFAIDEGATKDDADTAPANAFFTTLFREASYTSLTEGAWELFDAAVAWAIGVSASATAAVPITAHQRVARSVYSRW